MTRIAIILIAVLIALATALHAIKDWEAEIEQRGYSRAMAEMAEKAQVATEAARAEEQRRIADKERLVNEAKAQAARDRAAVVAERAESERLRVALAAATGSSGQASSGSGITFGSSPIARVGSIAYECVGEYQKLAEAARASLTAGKTCERAYDQLTGVEPASTVSTAPEANPAPP
jgi:hypothetical protein